MSNSDLTTQPPAVMSASSAGSPARPKPQPKRVPWRMRDVLALHDCERVAKSFLPRMIHGFIAGAVETAAAQRTAAEAYEDYAFLPRVLIDVAKRDQSVTLFGKRYAVPFGIPPIGGTAIAAYRGDLQFAEAASAMQQPMIMSASSLIKLEDVQRAYPSAWFQAYLAGDNSRIEPMVARVAAAGFETLVITADTPLPGNREYNQRSGYSMPIRITPRVAWDCATHPGWLLGTLGQTFLKYGIPHFENMDAERGPPMFSRNLARNFSGRDSFSWTHMELIRRQWSGNLVIKGLLAPADVRRARDMGADGVIVSSHGGRQLDYAVAPLRMLPIIKAEVPDMMLMIDGGIRRGTDVLKALALGASAVFVGRPFIFANALAGRDGVIHAGSILKEEIDRNMGLLGITSLAELTTDYLVKTR